MQAESITVTVERDQAAELRERLRDHRRNGVTFTERRRWFFWRQFEITGPAAAISWLERQNRERGEEQWRREQW